MYTVLYDFFFLDKVLYNYACRYVTILFYFKLVGGSLLNVCISR